MARSEGFYERFAKSVAPSIFGNLGEATVSQLALVLIKISLRYQEGNNLFTVWRFEENSS